MSTKEFIKSQIGKLTTRASAEQFTELSESAHSLLILEVLSVDYTLTEIARLVESNNARVFALDVLPIGDGSSMLISLKLDVHDLTPVLRSFERFDYKVAFYFSREGEVTDTQKERLDELLYYLNM